MWVSVVVLDGYLAGTDLAAASIEGKSKRLLVSVTVVIGICRTGKDRGLIRTKLYRVYRPPHPHPRPPHPSPLAPRYFLDELIDD